MGAHGRRLLLLVCLVARTACAGLSSDDFGGSLALTSDDIYRGLSMTCGDPAAQGDLHYRSSAGETQSEVFAGVWGSAGLGHSACGKARELNAYGGFSLAPSQDSSASLTYTHYGYPGGSYTLLPLGGYRYDYDAIEAQWGWQEELFVTVTYSPDALRFSEYVPREDRSALSYGLQFHYPLPHGFSASAGAGYDQIDDPAGEGYSFWNAGLGYSLGPVQLQADYVGTDARATRFFGSHVAGSRGALSAVWRF